MRGWVGITCCTKFVKWEEIGWAKDFLSAYAFPSLQLPPGAVEAPEGADSLHPSWASLVSLELLLWRGLLLQFPWHSGLWCWGWWEPTTENRPSGHGRGWVVCSWPAPGCCSASFPKWREVFQKSGQLWRQLVRPWVINVQGSQNLSFPFTEQNLVTCWWGIIVMVLVLFLV